MSLQELLDKEPQYGTDAYSDWELECREYLQSKHGRVWNTSEVVSEFSIESFLAPFCFGTRRSDNAKISLTFYHHPRFYYDLKLR